VTRGVFAEIHAASLRDPESFWAEAAEDITWVERWDRVLDASAAPFYRWFPGATLNTCYNAVDRHVAAGRGAQLALLYDSPVTATKRGFTFAEVQAIVAQLAGALCRQGVARGDTVVIYMPMVPQAVFAMLACARLGAVHSVVFGGFAPPELGARIDDCKPKVVLSASCGLEPTRVVEYKPLLDKALSIAAHAPRKCVVLQRPEHRAALDPRRDIDLDDFVAAAEPHECVPVAATDPLYILYTSGTTGRPKGVVRDNGGHAVALHWSMRNIYAMRPGETYWAASDIGWVVGHSYIVYGPLLNGNTTVLYEGKPVGTPDAGAFWRVAAEHGVKTLFTAPTALRAIKREDPRGQLIGGHDLRAFEALFLAGERTDPATLEWAGAKLGVPVIDHWWQTETGWAICANCRGIEPLPVKPGSASLPVPGMDVRVLDARGQGAARTNQRASRSSSRCRRARSGALECREPVPGVVLRSVSGITRRPTRYIDADGYVFVMSRTDDVINVAGHRLSTGDGGSAGHARRRGCAVFGVNDELKGEVPRTARAQRGVSARGRDRRRVSARIRDQIGPVAAFKTAGVVKRLPKTRSGKVLRGTMRRIANGEPWTMPATIDEPTVLDEIGATLAALGLEPGTKAL
jgi:propionyl-CoA synthetase